MHVLRLLNNRAKYHRTMNAQCWRQISIYSVLGARCTRCTVQTRLFVYRHLW